jgi:hypothetical protein
MDKAFGGLKAESLAYISPVATPWVNEAKKQTRRNCKVN